MLDTMLQYLHSSALPWQWRERQTNFSGFCEIILFSLCNWINLLLDIVFFRKFIFSYQKKRNIIESPFYVYQCLVTHNFNCISIILHGMIQYESNILEIRTKAYSGSMTFFIHILIGQSNKYCITLHSTDRMKTESLIF